MPQQRYTIQVLTGHDRVRHLFRYHVTGRGPLPLDMLRHDRAWLAHPLAVARAQELPDVTRSIELVGLDQPTEARWLSFGWSVGMDDLGVRGAQ